MFLVYNLLQDLRDLSLNLCFQFSIGVLSLTELVKTWAEDLGFEQSQVRHLSHVLSAIKHILSTSDPLSSLTSGYLVTRVTFNFPADADMCENLI